MFDLKVYDLVCYLAFWDLEEHFYAFYGEHPSEALYVQVRSSRIFTQPNFSISTQTNAVTVSLMSLRITTAVSIQLKAVHNTSSLQHIEVDLKCIKVWKILR